MRCTWTEEVQVGVVRMTYLPLGSMAIHAGLGGTVAPTISVVNVEAELKVDYLSVKLDGSVRVAVHGTQWAGKEMEGGMLLGMG